MSVAYMLRWGVFAPWFTAYDTPRMNKSKCKLPFVFTPQIFREDVRVCDEADIFVVFSNATGVHTGSGW